MVSENNMANMSLQLRNLEDNMRKAAQACDSDSAVYLRQAGIYEIAKRVFNICEELESVGVSHSDAMMIALLRISRLV